MLRSCHDLTVCPELNVRTCMKGWDSTERKNSIWVNRYFALVKTYLLWRFYHIRNVNIIIKFLFFLLKWWGRELFLNLFWFIFYLERTSILISLLLLFNHTFLCIFSGNFYRMTNAFRFCLRYLMFLCSFIFWILSEANILMRLKWSFVYEPFFTLLALISSLWLGILLCLWALANFSMRV